MVYCLLRFPAIVLTVSRRRCRCGRHYGWSGTLRSLSHTSYINAMMLIDVWLHHCGFRIVKTKKAPKGAFPMALPPNECALPWWTDL